MPKSNQTSEAPKVVLFERTSDYAKFPEKAHTTDTGFDLFSVEGKRIRTGEWEVIRIGWKVRLPQGMGLQIRPRSGLAVQHGVTVLNAPGTIDEGYTDEIKVILINLSKRDFVVKVGSRIAQMVFETRQDSNIVFQEGLAGQTERKGGFGHTGETDFLNTTPSSQLDLFMEIDDSNS